MKRKTAAKTKVKAKPKAKPRAKPRAKAPAAKAKRSAKASKPWSVSDVRQYFQHNRTPIYFISATNFNVLGIDEWVRNFHYINYIDCFDGQHPTRFGPSEIAHGSFTSSEVISNYLLVH
jgi:hypothetical protein